MSNELDLTYGEISAGLIEAIERREQAAEELMHARTRALDPGCESWEDEALAAFDAAETVVREYLKAEVKKADSIVGYVRRTEALAEARRREAQRLYELAKADEQRVAWLKEITMIAMREMDLRKCEGARGILQLWGNGGKQPVEVRQPELLPAKYQRFTLTLSGTELHQLAILRTGLHEAAKPIEPDTDLIRRDLLTRETCHYCQGTKVLANAECQNCGGEGTVGGHVPGAVLKPYGEHLRVK
jgi:hypothetical protein